MITCLSPNHESSDSFLVVDSFVDHLVDAVGAGDALLAYATLTKMSTGSDVIASIVGSIAAAVECEYEANIPVTPNDLVQKIDQIAARVNFEEV